MRDAAGPGRPGRRRLRRHPPSRRADRPGRRDRRPGRGRSTTTTGPASGRSPSSWPGWWRRSSVGDGGEAVDRHETGRRGGRTGGGCRPSIGPRTWSTPRGRTSRSVTCVGAGRALVDADGIAPAEVRCRPVARTVIAEIARAPARRRPAWRDWPRWSASPGDGAAFRVPGCGPRLAQSPPAMAAAEPPPARRRTATGALPAGPSRRPGRPAVVVRPVGPVGPPP